MIVVFGGYGVFGSLVAGELAAAGLPVTVAGRDAARAQAAARALGANARGVAADVTDPASCRAALAGARVAVSCAGPFSAQGTALLDACLAASCHYADIAEDRAHAALVRAHGDRFAALGLAAVYGCSSLPSLSGALAMRARGDRPPPRRVRVTLFIGNDNPKGSAAVATAVAQLGRPFAAPQGPFTGFRGAEAVLLPAPFGRRTVYDFDSPEYDLFPALTGAREVAVKVGFEMRLATAMFAGLARTGPRFGARAARVLGVIGAPLRIFGHSGGVVQSDLTWDDGEQRGARVFAREHAQRMVALPCALAAAALAAAAPARPGAQTAYDLLGPAGLLDAVAARGYEVHDL